MPVAKYSFMNLAYDVLAIAKAPLTYQEIWTLAVQSGLVVKMQITGKTPDRSMGARIFIDVRDNPNSKFVKVGKNPARFWLKNRQKELGSIPDHVPETPAIVPTKQAGFGFHERKLHPLLAYFAYTNSSFHHGKQIYTKTIRHEQSKHSGPSEWVYPDMVGFYSPIDDWNNRLLEFNRVYEKSAIKLYSFEIKKQIDRGNYRECFFQAVSNSSWAHESYLATCEVQQQDDLLSELERLSASFGIGVIVLDLEDIDSSTVLFPSKTRGYLDWEAMNKLCEQNKDFEAFIADVQLDCSGGKIHPSEYDRIIPDPVAYIESMRKE
jgi:uncharacterized protein